MISPKWMEPDYTHIMWTLHVWIPYPHKYWALYALIYALWVLLTVKMRLKVLWKNHLYHLGIYVFRYKWEAAGLCTINCSSWVVLKQETIEIYIWELCMWYLYIYIYMCVCVWGFHTMLGEIHSSCTVLILSTFLYIFMFEMDSLTWSHHHHYYSCDFNSTFASYLFHPINWKQLFSKILKKKQKNNWDWHIHHSSFIRFGRNRNYFETLKEVIT